MKLKLVCKGTHLFQRLLLLLCVGHGTADSPNKNILGRMSHVDKLHKLSSVSAVFQQISPNGIGGQRAETFLQNSIAAKNRQSTGLHLTVKFMLTAGNGKNQLCLSLHSIV